MISPALGGVGVGQSVFNARTSWSFPVPKAIHAFIVCGISAWLGILAALAQRDDTQIESSWFEQLAEPPLYISERFWSDSGKELPF